MTKTERIAQMLEQNEGIKCEVTKVTKGGVELDAIVIGSGNVRPTVYPDRMPGTDEEIVDEIVNIAICGVPSVEIERLTDWEVAKDLVTLAIRPRVKDNVATLPYLDLEVYAEVPVTDNGTTKVTNEILGQYGVSTEELISTAANNSKYTVKTMLSLFESFFVEEEHIQGLEKLGLGESPFLVATNEKTVRGASILYRADRIGVIADFMETDFWILPSSVHEVLLLPVFAGELEALKEIVQHVNDTDVLEEERLSYNVYKYERSTGKVVIAK